MKTEKVYKLVYIDDVSSEMTSACVWLNSDVRLEYHVDEWTTPKLGKIFAFDSLESAKSGLILISDGTDNYKLFEAEAIISENQINKMLPIMSIGRVEDFWRNPKQYIRRGLYTKDNIKGTIFCDKLKLIKEVTL